MLKVTVSGVVFLALVALCGATNSRGFLYPFEINSQLVCHIPNPFENIPGQPATIPETPPRIPFGVPTVLTDSFFPGRLPRNETRPYQLWLPQESGFRMPSFRGFKEEDLRTFLGNDFNTQLTSIEEPPPGSVAPRACDLLPAIEGSANQQRQHVEMENETISLVDETVSGGFFPIPNSLIFNQTISDRFFSDVNRVRFNSDFGISDFDRTRRVIRETNEFEALCDVWIAKCPLTSRWVKLPHSYWPPYVSLSLCSGKNCSAPLGLTCQEDFTYTVHVTVLRWDCCYNQLNREVRWDCGWRKVQIPIFCDCTCSCYEVSHG